MNKIIFNSIWKQKVTCLICSQEVTADQILNFNFADESLWRGCVPCAAKPLIEYPKNLKRIADLEKRVEGLYSLIRK